MSSPDAAVKAAPAAEPADPETGHGWDWLDTCGVIAGVVLVVIAIDVFTDGRFVSRRLRGQPAPAPEPDVVPGE